MTGGTEARLAFAGATWELEGDGILVADLGGGSTELVLGDVAVEDGVRVRDIEASRSIDVGSKRITELFLASDPPTPLELEEARVFVTRELRPYFDGLRTRPRLVVVTCRDGDDALGDQARDAGLRCRRGCTARAWTGPTSPTCSRCSPRCRSKGACRSSGSIRAELPSSSPATLILETVVGLAGLDSTLVSEHDILYGILLETYAGGVV